MIINHNKKYIFIGLPYSASGAISRELVNNYGGIPILSKHSNIPTLLKLHPEIDIGDYFIFVVVRDPIDIALTMYNKMVLNSHNIYTNPSHFKKNDGFIRNKTLEIYENIHKHNLSFQQYLMTVYRYRPYDNDLSMNTKYLNGIIRFNYLNDDFRSTLSNIGIIPKRDIPIFNKTDNKVDYPPLSKEDIHKFFGPFYKNNSYFNKPNLNISNIRNIIFKSLQFIRYYKRLYSDISIINSGKYKDVFLKK